METDGADKTTALEKLFEVGIVKKALCNCEVIFVFFFFAYFFVIDRLKSTIPKSDFKLKQSLRLFLVSVS